MLTQAQSREYNRCQKLYNFFAINSIIINTYVPFAEEVTSFNTNFNRFQGFVPGKGASGTGITASQKELRLKISLAIANICDTACAYAAKYNNTNLASEVCFTKSDIQRLKDGDILGVVIRIANALSPLMQDADFLKYELTQQMLTDVMADATTFNSNIGKAGLIDSGSSIANKNLNEGIKLLRNNIKQFDRLINKFADTHPDFIEGYKMNSVADNTGTHHSGIAGTIKNAATGEPIKEARIQVDGSDKMTASDLVGYYELMKLRAGDYEVNFSAAGYTSKTMVLRVARGKTTKVDITL